MFRKKETAEVIKTKQTNMIIFLAYLVLGVYFINKKFNLIKIPEQVIQFDEWIIVVGGFFLLFGAIHYFKASRRL